MKLFNWNVEDLKPKFSNMVEKFWGENKKEAEGEVVKAQTVPSVNIANEKESFELNIAVPGLDKKGIKIEVDNGCLVVSSENEYTNEEREKYWLRQEYSYSSFRRVFQLPKSVDQNQIKATMDNGILHIKVGKAKRFWEIGTKKIKVK